MKKIRRKSGFLSLLVCQNEMPFEYKVNQIDDAEEPTPTNEQEQYEYNDVYKGFRTKHNGQSYEDFYNPTNEGKDEKNYL